jgi:hypothetical protein
LAIAAIPNSPPIVQSRWFALLAPIIVHSGLEPADLARATAPDLIEIAVNSISVDAFLFLDYLINCMCVSDKHAADILRFGFLDRISGTFPDANPKSQVKMFEAVANLAVDPPECTMAVLKCDLVQKLEGILRNGELMLKKAGLTLILRIVVKSNISDAVEVCRKNIHVLVDVLFCDEEEMLYDCLMCFGFLFSRSKELGLECKKMFEGKIIERLEELMINGSDSISQISQNLLRVLSSA